jgi:hypothetical protein
VVTFKESDFGGEWGDETVKNLWEINGKLIIDFFVIIYSPWLCASDVSPILQPDDFNNSANRFTFADYRG